MNLSRNTGKHGYSKIPFKRMKAFNSTNLTHIYFILSCMILTKALFDYVPYLNKAIQESQAFTQRFSNNHFSYFVSNSSTFVKVCQLLSTLTLLAIGFTLYSLLKQRISVPELKLLKLKNNLMLLSFLTATPITLLSYFFYNETLLMTKHKLKLYDNITTILYFIPTYLVVYFSKSLLSTLSSKDHSFYNPKIMIVKTIIHFLMTCAISFCKHL